MEIVQQSHSFEQMGFYYAEHLASEPKEHVTTGAIIRFSWNKWDAPAHSEPVMDPDRVFILILIQVRQRCGIYV